MEMVLDSVSGREVVERVEVMEEDRDERMMGDYEYGSGRVVLALFAVAGREREIERWSGR